MAVAESPQKRMTDDEVGTLWERISRQVAMEKRVKEKNSCFSYVWPGLLLAYQCWH